MKASVFGLGYVGCVLTACLANHGHDVTGVDINPQKVQAITNGGSPVEEPGVEDRIAAGVAEGRVDATTDAAAVRESDVSFITVGTPLDDTGQLNTTNVYNVADSIAEPLRGTDGHTVVLRSTVPPRTTRNLRSYLDDAVGDGTDVSVVANPEFLREGCAIDDFHDPPYVVLGAFQGEDPVRMRELYASFGLDDRIEVVSPEVAESLKMVNNVFHALKICFANEVGSVASAAGVDGRELLSLVRKDRKLNISGKYLEPGFAFGGSCLPKDTRAMATVGESQGVAAPLIASIAESNETHLDRVRERVESLDGDTVGVAGIAFKSGTTDTRNSPALRLVNQLEKDVVLYAGDVDVDGLVGSNRDYLDRTLPDIDSHLAADAEAFLERADIVVFANDGDYDDIAAGITSQPVCDPVGAVRDRADQFESYHSISW